LVPARGWGRQTSGEYELSLLVLSRNSANKVAWCNNNHSSNNRQQRNKTKQNKDKEETVFYSGSVGQVGL